MAKARNLVAITSKIFDNRMSQSCPQCGSQFVESVEHNISLALWLNKCGVMHLTLCGNSLSKEVTSILKNIFNDAMPLFKTLTWLDCHRFFFRSGYLWINYLAPTKNMDSHAPDVANQDVLEEFDLAWCVKGLIVTWSN